MRLSDMVTRYLDGLANGDPDAFLPEMAPDYVMHDGNASDIARDDMPAFIERFGAAVGGLGRSEKPWYTVSDRLDRYDEHEHLLTVWFWWECPGTPVAGAGLVKADGTGVRWERVTYFVRPEL